MYVGRMCVVELITRPWLFTAGGRIGIDACGTTKVGAQGCSEGGRIVFASTEQQLHACCTAEYTAQVITPQLPVLCCISLSRPATGAAWCMHISARRPNQHPDLVVSPLPSARCLLPCAEVLRRRQELWRCPAQEGEPAAGASL